MNRKHPNPTALIDVNTEGPRYDVTPLFADFESFSALVEELLAQSSTIEFDYVAGIDALGFILGTALSFRAHKGFLPIRKGGKLPVKTLSVHFVDYSGQEKSLEIRIDAIKPGARVLLVDEWIETGAQVNAAIELIERLKGVVIGIATINIDENKETEKLKKKYKCYTVWTDK
ncbi:MAG: purine phosphoribosyltransferase family protein [Anaerolineales bacterium]